MAGLSSKLSDIPLTGAKQLADQFRAGAAKIGGGEMIGMEWEKIFVVRDEEKDLWRPANPRDVDGFLKAMYNPRRYEPEYEKNDLSGDGLMTKLSRPVHHLIGLNGKGDDAIGDITVEPAGQIEISCTPQHDLHGMRAVMERHLEECREACEITRTNMLAIGAHPSVNAGRFPLMPKARYKILLDALDRSGITNHIATPNASNQWHVSFKDEADFVKKYRVALAIQPVLTAMFGNSPFEEGEPGGYVSKRNFYYSRLSTVNKLNRVGIPEFVFEEGFGFDKLAEVYLNDVKSVFLIGAQGAHPSRGAKLQKLIDGEYADGNMEEEGVYNRHIRGWKPTMADARGLMSTVWWEVRPTLIPTLEFRGTDTGQPDDMLAIGAMIVGIMYDQETLDAVYDKIMQWTPEDRQALYEKGAHYGLKDEAVLPNGEKVYDIARGLYEAAERGLQHRAERLGIESEAKYLEPARIILETRMTPADRLVEKFHSAWGEDIDRAFIDESYWPEMAAEQAGAEPKPAAQFKLVAGSAPPLTVQPVAAERPPFLYPVNGHAMRGPEPR